jgi:hypothetical protein
MFRGVLLAALLTGSMALSGVASCEGFFGPEESRLRPGSHIACEQNSDCPRRRGLHQTENGFAYLRAGILVTRLTGQAHNRFL